jgi:hypothetical protein
VKKYYDVFSFQTISARMRRKEEHRVGKLEISVSSK